MRGGMDPVSIYLVVALGALVAGFVQGLSGFAFSMVSMSLWAWTLEPQLAAVLAVCGGWTGQVLAAVTVRRGFNARRLLPFVLGGLAGVPLGVWLLPQLDVAVFKTGLGLLLALFCPIMLLLPRLPRLTRGGRGADAAVGLAGGVLGGLGGFTGVLPTLWCTLRDWARDEQRAVIQNFNLAMLSATLLGYLGTGFIRLTHLPLIGIVVLAVLLPVLAGARLYHGLSAERFRQIVLGLLTASGVALLAVAVPVLLQRAA